MELTPGRVVAVRADARQLPLPTQSVDLIVTSPPYWQQRTYTDHGTPVDRQTGQEPTPTAYIDALVAATREWQRVLKPTGSLWVNLGDKQRRSGSLALLPQRYSLACTDRLGLTVRAEVIWHKPSSIPEGRVHDRATRTHETWWHLTAGRGYYADLTPLRETPVWTRKGGTTVRHKPRVTVGQSTHGWTTDGHPDGKPPGSVWTIPTDPFPRFLDGVADLDTHTAAFPVEWPRRLILGWSPPGGVVLDPFGGTGTTAHVAAALGRTGISSDLSSAYSRLAAHDGLAARRRAKALTGSPVTPAAEPTAALF